MRKILNYGFLFILAVVSLVLVSCDKVKASDLVNLVLVDQESYVNEDFYVVGEVKDSDKVYPITWTSSDACLTVSETKNELGYYTVKVTRPEDSEKTITLTATITVSRNNKASKHFEFRVYPIDVYDILDEFDFEHKNAKITGGNTIELPQSASFAGKTATITWESTSELITISEDGDTATVAAVSKDTKVVLTATFSYKGQTTTMNYEVIAGRAMTEHEKLIEWYENTGITQVLSGYVVEIATAYSESYGNVSLYIVNDSFTGGYYLYRVKMDAAEAAQLKVGAHVTATGTTNTSYSGLMETNAGGELKVDEDVAEINVKEHIYAMDNDYIANAPSLYYRTSTLVSVTGWEVAEVKALSADSNPATVLKLKKDGVTLSVVYSKYVASTPLNKDNDVYKAVDAKLATIAVGDFVDVTGVLSYYNKANTKYDQKSYQVMIQNADSIVKNTTATAVSDTDAKKVGNAIKAFAGFKPIYTKDGEITLPATLGDASVTWAFHNEAHTGVEFKDETKTALTVTAGDYSLISLDATFKSGEYSTVVYYSFVVEKLSAEDIVKRAAGEVELKKEYSAGEYELPTENEIFEDVEFSYAVESGPAIIDGDTLVVLTPQATSRVVLVVTATMGEASASSKIRFDALSSDVYVVVEEKDATKGYKLGLYQENLGKTLLFAGTTNASGFYETTTDGTKAVDVYVEEAEGGIYLYYVNKDKKNMYLNLVLNADNKTRFAVEETPSTVWTYNEEYDTYTGTINEKEYFIGTYNTFDTLSPSETKYFTSGNFITHFYQVAKLTEEYAVDYELSKIDLAEKLMVGEYDIVTNPSLYDTEITYTIVEGEDIATIADGKLVLATDLKEATVKIKVEVAAGEVSKSKEFTISVFNITYAMTSYFEVGVPYKLGLTQENLNKDLFFKGTANSSGFYETVESVADGADIYLEEATNGYYIYTLKGETKNYLNIFTNSSSQIRFEVSTTAKTVWAYSAKYNTFLGTHSGSQYFIGTYNTFNTFSPSALKYIESGNFISNLFKVEAQNECTVADAFAAEKGTPVVLNGTVVAVSAKSIVVWDGTAAVHVWLNAAPTVAVGAAVQVTGTMDNYNGSIQVANPQVKALAGGKEYTGTYTTVSGADIEAYVTSTTWNARYVEFTGTLSISGKYYNVAVEGATTAQGSIYQITDAVKAEVADGVVTLRGWVVGVSSNKYYNVIVTEVITADDVKAEVAAALTGVNAGTLEADLTLPTTAAGYTLAWTDAEGNAITKITYAAGETIKATANIVFHGSTVKVADYEFKCIAAGAKTVTLSYSGATGNMGTGNEAAKLGLDASVFSVVGSKVGASNNVGLNKDGSIRFYSGNNKLTITATNATITTITITYATPSGYAGSDAAFSVTVNGSVVALSNGTCTINASSFVIQNNQKAAIKNIVINYIAN